MLKCGCLLLAVFGCIGWADSLEELKSASDAVTSVKAEFVQQKHLAILEQPLVSRGLLFYQAPHSLRWEYTQPIHSILLMHKGRVRRFIEDGSGFHEESGADLNAMQVVLQEISNWLAGKFDQNPLFQVRLVPGRRIVLTPRDEAFTTLIERIELLLSSRPGVIRSVFIYEGPAAYTRLDFEHSVLNQTIDDAVFRFAP